MAVPEPIPFVDTLPIDLIGVAAEKSARGTKVWGAKMVSKNTICLWYDGTALDATKFYADPDRAVSKRAFEAMMEMNKNDIAAIEAARRG